MKILDNDRAVTKHDLSTNARWLLCAISKYPLYNLFLIGGNLYLFVGRCADS